MKHKNKKILIIASLFFMLTSCQNKTYSNSNFYFDTFCSWNFTSDEETNLNINSLIEKINILSDAYNTNDSLININYLNNHQDEFVEVDPLLIELLKKSLELQEYSNGLFNPLIGGLSNKMKNEMDKGSLLSNSNIEEEISIMNSSKIEFLDNKVKLSGGAQIDVGAIAKGFVLEKIYKSYEFKKSYYIFNFGESSILLGKPTKNSNFNIHQGEIITFEASNCVIGTSSIDEQYWEINGKKYSHIINPFTGNNLNKHQTVIVLGNSENSSLVDVSSTIFMMMDLEEIKLYESKYDLKVIVIDDNEVVYKNSGIYEVK